MTTALDRDRLHSLGLYAPSDGPEDDQGPCCRVCGCIDVNACYDEVAGEPCHWVDQDLCSVCARDLLP